MAATHATDADYRAASVATIHEACGIQDIAGQRVAKVVEPSVAYALREPFDSVWNLPASAADAMDQDEVDDLLGSI